VSQGFGAPSASVASSEPAMFADGNKAFWQPFPGSTYHSHFHPAVDFFAPEGSPVIASEAGTVIESYFDSTNGGGHKVRIEIRAGVSYCSNHMSRRLVAVGKRVERGQQIGLVGHTGWAFGSHDHFWLGFDDVVGSQMWPRLYDPEPFFMGGAKAQDPRIQPEPTIRNVYLNGPGVNIRTSADLDGGSSNIYATSRAEGIFRNGRRLAGLGYGFVFLKSITTDDGRWFRVTGFNRVLYLSELVAHF